MRLVKVSAEAGLGEKVIATAFESGLDQVSLRTVELRSKDSPSKTAEIIDIETSTPKAKRFVDTLLAADYYDPALITFNTRQPRSLVSDTGHRELTRPLVEPATDLFQELWQFSHITYGLVGRIFIGACLLSYGLIEAKTLLTIAGLLFLPLLPMVMAISYGIVGRQPKLALQGLAALATGCAVLVAGGAAVAAMCQPPMRSDDLSSPAVAVIICIAVGIAAGLAAIDDAGRRELIGLAAAAQIGMLPVMLGIGIVYGTPTSGLSLAARAGSLLANVATITISLMITHYVTNVVGKIHRVRDS
jgi:hypothetical protein